MREYGGKWNEKIQRGVQGIDTGSDVSFGGSVTESEFFIILY
jgi:hypothetical protein